MKNIFTYTILTLITGLLIAFFAFNLNKEYVDLRYTLSEKIPTKFIETSPAETIQQLVIKNNGNMPATKIQIKVNGFVKNYDILKNLVSDVVEEHNSNGYFEAIYPSLPPDAQFSYIFKTSGEGITKNNLEIRHNKGNATEALASDSQSTYSKIGIPTFFLAMTAFYFIMIALQGRSMAIDSLISRGSYLKYYDYLNKKKPIYVPQEKWDSIRREYIKGKIRPTYLSISNIEEEENYKILNQDKPKFLNEDEWELLKENASTSLDNQLSYCIKTSHTFNLEKYFLFKKPKHFPENKWQEIVKEINENFITAQELKKSFHLSTKDILKELELGIPSGMLPAFWDEYEKFLTDCYYELVYKEILRNFNPLKYLKEIDLSVLNKSKRELLEDISYKIQLLGIDDMSSLNEAEKFLKKDKPEWIKDNDLERLEKKAEAYIALDKSIRKNESLSNALNSIVNFTSLKEQPDTLDSSEWNNIIELERKIATASMKIEEDKLKLESNEQKTNELKDKVLKQLSIIDNVIIDPESIDKIEDYDNPFSKGNFANLKQIRDLSIKLKKTT
ncbi:MAG: hypothetical protein P9L89_08030 [Candidatus Celaenobacter polaris]|nr:hypothetical protein [Candidatus Celaenobacter polaris]